MRVITKAICLLVSSIFIPGMLSSQDCNPRTIVTDVSAPAQNTQRPAKTNTFDWKTPSYPLNSLYFPNATSIESPFQQGGNTNVTQLVLTNDMKPEDGWELIRRDFGFQDNGSPAITPIFMPKLMLYNKRTGVFRVIIARGELQETYQSAFIKINWDAVSPYQTSALDYTKRLLSLEEPFVKNTFFISPAKYFNAPLKWFYADFPIQYDPCTCFYQSLLNIKTEFYESTDIKIKGLINGKIVTAGTNPTTEDKDFLTSFQSAGKKGVKALKSVDKLINGSKSQASNVFNFNQSIVNIKNSSLDQLGTALKSKAFLKTLFSAVPYLDEAMSLLELFTGGGKASGPAQVELMPLTVDLGLTMEGTLTKKKEYDPDVFNTPGNATVTSPPVYYPYYNKTMGVVNLITSPRADFYDYFDIIDPNTGGLGMYRTWKLKFTTPIKYALNPDADLFFYEEPQIAVLFKGKLPNPSMQLDFFGQLETQADDGSFIVRSQYTPFSCLNDYTFSFTSRELVANQFGYEYGEIEPYAIKIRYNFGITSNPAAQNVLYQQVYEGIRLNMVSDPSLIPNSFVQGCIGPSFFTQISPSDLNTFCTSTTGYASGHQSLRRPSNPGNPDIPPVVITDTKFSIGPNPTSSSITIKYELPEDMNIDIKLLSTQGKMIYLLQPSKFMKKGKYNELINLPEVPAGMYFVQLNLGNTQKTQKIIIY
jgi:hypothetical protein